MAEGYEPQPVPKPLTFVPANVTVPADMQNKLQVSNLSKVGEVGYVYICNLVITTIADIPAAPQPYSTKFATINPAPIIDITGEITNGYYETYGMFILTQAGNLWCSTTKIIPNNTQLVLTSVGVSK